MKPKYHVYTTDNATEGATGSTTETIVFLSDHPGSKERAAMEFGCRIFEVICYQVRVNQPVALPTQEG